MSRAEQSGVGLNLFSKEDYVIIWRKLTAAALIAFACLLGVSATAAAKPGSESKSESKLDRKLKHRAERGGSGLSRVIVTPEVFASGKTCDGIRHEPPKFLLASRRYAVCPFRPDQLPIAYRLSSIVYRLSPAASTRRFTSA